MPDSRYYSIQKLHYNSLEKLEVYRIAVLTTLLHCLVITYRQNNFILQIRIFKHLELFSNRPSHKLVKRETAERKLHNNRLKQRLAGENLSVLCMGTKNST